MIKKILFFFLIINCTNLFAQKDNFWLYGKIKDSLGIVKNANIINLKTNSGTFSNDFGDYKIIVSIGDSIQFSSVQHKTVYRIVNNFIYRSEVLDVFMINNRYELEEVVVKTNDLDGFLSIDLKKTPIDRKGEALKKTMDLTKVNMKVIYDGDYIDQKVRPPINNVDPTSLFAGMGSGVSIPVKFSEKLWALRRDIEFKQKFPFMLVSEFGEPFFENDLKIPLNKLHHFLEFCNPTGIEDLYKQNRKLELIVLLKNESFTYLKSLENR